MPRGWAVAGATAGLAAGALAFAPASWLAHGVAEASGGRLLLAEPRGTVWTGSARTVLSGGAGSRGAAVLPGRLEWRLRIGGGALELRARQDCCLVDTLRVRLRPGFGRLRVELPARDGAVAHWPLGWLAGLGTPWNTLDLSGQAALTTRGLAVEAVQGRWRFEGGAELELRDVGSRLARLPVLGSYRLALSGGGEAAQLLLTTSEGALRLEASGQWAAGGLRLRGEAHAAPGQEAALDNLLNLIGRRRGAASMLSIG